MIEKRFEAIHTASGGFEIRIRVSCWSCRGAGFKKTEPMFCSDCNGQGSTLIELDRETARRVCIALNAFVELIRT